MSLSLMMAATVENAVIITHGPIGCGSTMHALSVGSNKGKVRRGKAPNPPVWLTTNMNESDVISGGEGKLRDTIIHADREFRPEIIFVVSTCAPSIIGDDVEEVVRQANEQTTANVTAIHCPGFKSRVVASAYDAFYHSLLRHIRLEPLPYRDYQPVDPSDPDYEMKLRRFEYQKKMTVNLFNATSIGPDDEAELKRLLGALGLNVRIFAEYCGADELRMMSHAGLNLSMCNVHDDYILSYLEERYGTPYIIAGMPLGFSATRAWLMKVAEHFGVEERAEKLIEDEERGAREAIEPFLPQVKGKRVLVCGGVIRSGTEAVMLKELGLEVVAVRAYHYDNGADPVLENVARELPETPVAVSHQSFEFLNQIRRYKPDLVISHGGTHGFLARAGATSIQLFDVDKPFFGYSGVFSILKRIVFAFKNTSYQERLSKRVKFPYVDEWYEKDPFSYIKK
jgi:nitrogenase molybdenum-iron protein alpha chain